MKFHHPMVMLLGVLLAGISPAFAQGEPTLKVGDPAPPLQVSKWVQGEEVTSFQKGNVYVLECWATWCGPCISAIPHVSQMHTRFKDQGVVIIGLNVWERDTSKVEPFVKNMGDKMNYRVAMDDKSEDPQGAMATTWMRAAGRNGIPCSFVVDKEGKIAWIGHPMAGLDRVVELVVKDKYDAKAEAERQAKVDALRQQAGSAQRDGDWKGMVAALEQLAELDPEEIGYPLTKAAILFERLQDYEAGFAATDKMIEAHADDPEVLVSVAQLIAGVSDKDKARPDKAIELAERAHTFSGGTDPMLVATVATVYYRVGNLDKAIERMAKAAELTDNARMKSAMQGEAEKWRKQRGTEKGAADTADTATDAAGSASRGQ